MKTKDTNWKRDLFLVPQVPPAQCPQFPSAPGSSAGPVPQFPSVPVSFLQVGSFFQCPQFSSVPVTCPQFPSVPLAHCPQFPSVPVSFQPAAASGQPPPSGSCAAQAMKHIYDFHCFPVLPGHPHANDAPGKALKSNESNNKNNQQKNQELGKTTKERKSNK